jgi:ADP-heptose:LPS heptosyltransferase
MIRRVLAVRHDNNGDVILAGPAIRAVAASGARVTLLCGARGAAVARMLPGVRDVEIFETAWIEAEPKPVDAPHVAAFVTRLRKRAFDEAVIFTSFQQSALPIALLLRLAEIPRIGAISDDSGGALLDVCHHVGDGAHEVTRARSLVRAMGYPAELDDSALLALRGLPDASRLLPDAEPYVLVHPGGTAPAKRWSSANNTALVRALVARGWRVVVTGASEEIALTASVAGDSGALDLGGCTTFGEFAALVRRASVVVCGNTAASHVAAAVQTPVVCIFPPTVPAARFRPWKVPHVLLGNQLAPCAGCRVRACPIAGQPCLAGVTVDVVLAAVERLARRTVTA